MHFRRDGNIISFSGSLSIGREYRTIEGDIYIVKSGVVVDSKITRLCVETDRKEYTVLDEFKLEKNSLKRRSQYNYNMENLYTKVTGISLKG